MTIRVGQSIITWHLHYEVMVEVVNIVGGGDLGAELDLSELSSYFSRIDECQVDFNSESKNNTLQLRFEEEGPLCMVYRTGKFVITGADSNSSLNKSFHRLLEEFRNINKVNESVDLRVYNKVFTEDFEKDIELSKFAIYLGFENTEYEPEQTPFLIYKPTNIRGVVTIASSGKVVVNGIRTEKEAVNLIEDITQKLDEFLSQ